MTPSKVELRLQEISSLRSKLPSYSKNVRYMFLQIDPRENTSRHVMQNKNLEFCVKYLEFISIICYKTQYNYCFDKLPPELQITGTAFADELPSSSQNSPKILHVLIFYT